jgi:catechol 2,3-dioxygenase-like lactoylglutathione lyase family enzyme
MKLTFIYAPVPELKPALAFYRDTLGWSEAWREGEDTVAFRMPDSPVQVMVSVASPNEPAGPMYQVPNLARFMAEHPQLPVVVAQRDIPDGHVIGVTDPGGNVIYLFDQVAG